MTQIKRRVNAGAACTLVSLTLLLSVYVIAPCGASLEVAQSTGSAPHIAWATTQKTEALPIFVAASYTSIFRIFIAQGDIPDVLIPSVVPTAEPTFVVNTPTPSPTKAATNVSKNATQKTTGGFDLVKILGSIPPLFIIALIPLLFVIGALFYFFFMGDQERGASDEDETEGDLSTPSEETGWRKL